MSKSRSFIQVVMFAAAVLLVGVLFTPACINPPEFEDIPKIEFVSLSKDTLLQGVFQEDSLRVTFHFEDGDGDLGREEDAVENNVFFIDTRTGELDNSFGIPFIPAQGSSNGIEGEVHILLFSTCCLYPDNGPDPCTIAPQYPTNTLSYQIYIKDREGHESNMIETPPITLICQ